MNFKDFIFLRDHSSTGTRLLGDIRESVTFRELPIESDNWKTCKLFWHHFLFSFSFSGVKCRSHNPILLVLKDFYLFIFLIVLFLESVSLRKRKRKVTQVAEISSLSTLYFWTSGGSLTCPVPLGCKHLGPYSMQVVSWSLFSCFIFHSVVVTPLVV